MESFREGQQEIVESVIGGTDTLVFMPTGGGKSLTYQFPGVVREGITIVISPLISLMKDQLDKLNQLGIRSACINSTVSTSEQSAIFEELRRYDAKSENPIKFLYIAPERLNSTEFVRVVKTLKIALVAIDEAHCISQWGHDFRPSYMKINGFLGQLRSAQAFPIMALTATATEKVRKDIIERLGLTEYKIFTKGFDRKNIIVLVREISAKKEKLAKTLEIIRKTLGTGIIYCSSRKMVTEVYEFLAHNDIPVGMYTGAMTADDRERMQNLFMTGEYRAIVATNAFGMGIDKQDVRFVIHYNLPGSIENYYQEVGRAGRDGKTSYGVVLASYGDTKIQEFFIDNTYPARSDILKVYEYLYEGFEFGEGSGHRILKTQAAISREVGLESDLQAGVIIKILEKYGILMTGVEGEVDEDFRGKGVTMLLPKTAASHVPIDWQKQELLKTESYFKLEQVKKLLFSPSCRKRFILEYFGDKEDLENLGDSCGACDYCIDREKFKNGNFTNLVQLSVFEIVLDVIARYHQKFGVNLIAGFLVGSADKKIIERQMDRDESCGILREYSTELVVAVIESLIRSGYLEKTEGMYPLLGITGKGKFSTSREQMMKQEESELQSHVALKAKTAVFKKGSSSKGKASSGAGKAAKKTTGGTYEETLRLLKSGMNLKEIAKERDVAAITIESHIVKLYETKKLSPADVARLTNPEHLARVRELLRDEFTGKIEKLRPIKDRLEALNLPLISYFEIKVAVAMEMKKSSN